MANYTTINRKKDYYLGYVCSLCGNPVFMPLIIYTRIVHQQSMFHDTSVEELAENEINDIVQKINNSAADRSLLGPLAHAPQDNIWSGQEMRDQIDKKTLGTTWISTIHHFCPICGHFEPWMEEKKTAELKEKLQPDNFPRTFVNRDRAFLWAKLKLQNQLDDLNARREGPNAVNEAITLYNNKLALYNKTLQDLNQTDKRQTLQYYTDELRQLDLSLSACKAFDFKLKKELGQKIDAKKLEIDNLQKDIKQTETALLKQKTDLECELSNLFLFIKGPDGTVEEYISAFTEGMKLRVAKTE